MMKILQILFVCSSQSCDLSLGIWYEIYGREAWVDYVRKLLRQQAPHFIFVSLTSLFPKYLWVAVDEIFLVKVFDTLRLE